MRVTNNLKTKQLRKASAIQARRVRKGYNQDTKETKLSPP
jgi:hypothetical protein